MWPFATFIAAEEGGGGGGGGGGVLVSEEKEDEEEEEEEGWVMAAAWAAMLRQVRPIRAAMARAGLVGRWEEKERVVPWGVKRR